MTDREYRELLAELARKEAESRTEIDRQLKELRASQAETGAQLKETGERINELRASQAETGAQLKETGAQIKELRAFQAETFKEMRASQAKTGKRIKELGKQIGGLGKKFGSFTEGMAFPSMERVLRDRFRMESVALRQKKRRNGTTMELDVFAYSNSRSNEAFVVEVKSHLREEGYKRLLQVLRDFPHFFPEHRDKRLFGILACVDAPEHLEQRVLRSGIYLAKIHDETFRLQVPDGFVPKSYQSSRQA